MNSHLELNNRIKKLRKEKGLTQNDLAKFCYCFQNQIADIENYKCGCSAFLSGLICVALGVKWEDCFFYVKDKYDFV